jgi:hypothetical protein
MSDYSKEYAEEKKSNIFFGRSHKVVHFKPFLKSFSYDIKYKKNENTESIYTSVPMTDEFDEATYKFAFDVLASSVEEAIENHSKYQKLLRIIMPVGEATLTPPFIYVKFSNLIHNAKPTAYKSMSYALLETVGQRGSIEKLDYKPDMNMGFFEHNGLIFAKAFSIDIMLFISSPEAAGLDVVELDKDNQIVHGRRSGFTYGYTKI